jgi:hypothetical protein
MKIFFYEKKGLKWMIVKCEQKKINLNAFEWKLNVVVFRDYVFPWDCSQIKLINCGKKTL